MVLMDGVYFHTNKQMTVSTINRNPVDFIKKLTDYVQNLGYVEKFEFEVRMSPYRNRFLRLLDHAANYFRPKSIDLKDLEEVKEHHRRGYKLKFNSREKVLETVSLSVTRPVGAIVFRFSMNNTPYSIEVYNSRVEIRDLTPEEKNEEVIHGMCEQLLCGPFRELHS
jgi:hypothetical protein